MRKATKKVKEPVKIRFKECKNGSKSIYLDIYQDGKRRYEFLKLYLIPEKTPFDKEQNEVKLNAANAIKSQMVIDLANGKAGIKSTAYKKMLLSDLMAVYAKERAAKGQSLKRSLTIKAAAKLIEQYKEKATLANVDKDFCKGLAEYLKTAKVKGGKTISKSSAQAYFAIFNAALNFAMRRGIIEANPTRLMEADEKPTRGNEQREYLTIDELRQMMSTPTNDKVKKPFLFGCFTGLRFGDIMSLCWSDIVTNEGKNFVSIQTEKTQKRVFIPIPNEADILPERGMAKDSDFVFERISNVWANQVISQWADRARINKYVTFHTSRHTYATMLLTKGADLYTVSKLLGHSEIKTTQIYADIIDKKKEEAASLLEGIL